MPLRRPPAAWVPEPPVPLPEGRVVHVRGRGEFFVRDTGGDGIPVLLLHGWMFASDLNWWTVYDALATAGHRAIAMDLRGHGRGLRSPEPFRLEDCAADAAALLATLGTGPAVVVGYSMGGPVAQLMARDHRAVVRGMVLCATSRDWRDPYLWGYWRSMGLLRLFLGLFPTRVWAWLLRANRVPAGPESAWTAAELSRGSSVDLAEAGRELSRYDARPWLESLRDVPAAVVLTTRDLQVFPRKQRRLAETLGAPTFEVPAGHFAVTTHQRPFRGALLDALASVIERATSPAARAPEPVRG